MLCQNAWLTSSGKLRYLVKNLSPQKAQNIEHICPQSNVLIHLVNYHGPVALLFSSKLAIRLLEQIILSDLVFTVDWPCRGLCINYMFGWPSSSTPLYLSTTYILLLKKKLLLSILEEFFLFIIQNYYALKYFSEANNACRFLRVEIFSHILVSNFHNSAV